MSRTIRWAGLGFDPQSVLHAPADSVEAQQHGAIDRLFYTAGREPASSVTFPNRGVLNTHYVGSQPFLEFLNWDGYRIGFGLETYDIQSALELLPTAAKLLAQLSIPGTPSVWEHVIADAGDPDLHPTVTLAPGVIVTPEALERHGHILKNGCKGHRITITGFPIGNDGVVNIKLHMEPTQDTRPVPPEIARLESTQTRKH